MREIFGKKRKRNRFFLTFWNFGNVGELRVIISKVEGKLWRREGYYKKKWKMYLQSRQTVVKKLQMSNKNINRDKPCICSKKNVSLTKHFRPCQEILTLQHLERCNTDIENFKFQMIPYLIDSLLSKGAKKANCYCS